MEMKQVPRAGYPIQGLWISGLHRKLSIRNLMFPLKLIVSLCHSYFILKKFKPQIVIGTGGFASGPLLYMAIRMNIPSLIQEQNALPGITNRFLGKHVHRICIAHKEAASFFQSTKHISQETLYEQIGSLYHQYQRGKKKDEACTIKNNFTRCWR
ncbi:MAG: hypothetical protein CM15mP59_2090 [Flavobacteriaceae bacterium]|nr:MAG: hypothetical protein CM15mP59_2090 [Flavobacteriaceae bacterium]